MTDPDKINTIQHQVRTWHEQVYWQLHPLGPLLAHINGVLNDVHPVYNYILSNFSYLSSQATPTG